LDELTAYLDFLSAVFPKPALVFNIRDHRDVCQSGWWKKFDQRLLVESLSIADKLFTEYVDSHDNAFLVKYENITNDLYEAKSLLQFLGAPFDEKLIRDVLGIAHGYEQKAETLERGRVRKGL
jgi:hypothetical protein